MADPRAFDIAVLGAGPAGVGAAVAATRAGARVLIVDEAPETGGQVYRALPEGISLSASASSPEAAEGARQRAALAASGATLALGHRVWLVTEGFRIDALAPDGPVSWQAGRVIAATGTHERVVPFPGWTLPGVIGLAATTILLKSQRMAPGRRVFVAGCGPLLAYVGRGISKVGAQVVGVADLAGPGDWARALPRMVARPDLLARGGAWVAGLAASRVPYFPRSHVTRAERTEEGALRITLQRLGRDGAPERDGERVVEADALAVGHGLVPGTELTRLLRAQHDWQPERGGWVARRDARFRTTVPGLYLAGDGGGISGAAAAWHQGRIAGLAAVLDAGIGTGIEDQITQEARALRMAERFGRAMGAMMAPRPALYAGLGAETIVCRCEDIPRAEIEAAIDAGATEVNQIKQWTRCGMGPCQGRMCGEAAAEIVAARTGGDRASVGLWTGRAPLRPVALGDLAGRFDYSDIPIPKPAPL